MIIPDSLVPDVPTIDGCFEEDHETYIAPWNQSFDEPDTFMGYWKRRGYSVVADIQTELFPARHIAFGDNSGRMIGLSVSQDTSGPIYRGVQLWGSHHLEVPFSNLYPPSANVNPQPNVIAPGRLQHIAYGVDLKRSMKDVRAEMESKGTRFMTPILRYEDANGATLEQMFIACLVPYGPFVEIIRRGLGRNGEPFQGFNAKQIDRLYLYYDKFSQERFGKIK